MTKIPNNTRVLISSPYTGGQFEALVITHNVSYDTALVEVDGDTDQYTIRRFSRRLIRTLDTPRF